jgi:hypothetical protein
MLDGCGYNQSMRRCTFLVSVAVTVAATALTACGSGSSVSAATGASNGSAQLAFAKCVRSHGVPGFPDPGGAAPSGPATTIFGIVLPSTIDVSSPAFQSALNTCQKLITGGRPRPPLTAAKKRAALKFSQCMRTHGVPNFPDPVFAANGMIGIGIGKGNNPSSPAFQQAQQACGRP